MTIQGLLSKINMPEQEIEDLLNIARESTMSTGDNFIIEGDVPSKFAIVLNGLFRYYYLNSDGDEFTKGFIIEGQVMSSYSAMLYQKPSLFYIEALEKSQILEIDYKKWQELRSENSFWDKFLIQALEKGYCTKEKRERELLLLDAEQRYKIFLEEFPGFDKRVKLQVIASYLGIKPESLSRIRKKYKLT